MSEKNVNMLSSGILKLDSAEMGRAVTDGTGIVSVGDFVYLYDNAGVPTLGLASAANAGSDAATYAKRAVGIAVIVTTGTNDIVDYVAISNNVSTLTVYSDAAETTPAVAAETGMLIFLSASNPGKGTTISPSATGTMSQVLGTWGYTTTGTVKSASINIEKRPIINP